MFCRCIRYLLWKHMNESLLNFKKKKTIFIILFILDNAGSTSIKIQIFGGAKILQTLPQKKLHLISKVL